MIVSPAPNAALYDRSEMAATTAMFIKPVPKGKELPVETIPRFAEPAMLSAPATHRAIFLLAVLLFPAFDIHRQIFDLVDFYYPARRTSARFVQFLMPAVFQPELFRPLQGLMVFVRSNISSQFRDIVCPIGWKILGH